MKKGFGFSFAVYGIGGALGKFSALLTVPIYTRFLSTEGYGFLELATTFEGLLFILISMELHSGFARDYYQSRDDNELPERRGALTLYYFFAAAVVLAAVGGVQFANVRVFEGFGADTLLPIAIGLFPKLMINLTQVSIRFEDRASLFVLIVLLTTALSVSLGLIAVVGMDLGFRGILWSNAIASWVVFLGVVLKVREFSRFKLGTHGFKSMLYYGAPIVPAVLGGWVIQAMGRLFIAAMISVTALGVYALALKVGMIVVLAVQGFQLAWKPIVNRYFTSANSERKIAMALDMYLLVATPLVLAVVCASPGLVSLLAPSNFSGAIAFVGFIVVGNVLEGVGLIVSSGNCWERKTYFNSIGSVVGGITAFLVIWLWIGKWGTVIPAIALAVGVLVKCLITLWYSQRNHEIPYSGFSLFVALIVYFGFAAMNLYSVVVLRIDGWLFFLYGTGLAGLAYWLVLSSIGRESKKIVADWIQNLLVGLMASLRGMVRQQ